MAENWTDEQRQAIELRNRDLLVSAAAGSGKTAVLTARILGLVTDETNPVDIDRILVVTFTRAAAAEMRDRIRKAIRDRAEAEPGNARLRRQLSLLSHAQITTIDSFLSYVVRSNYSEIDIDPGFRTADEGETRLLMSDVFRGLLEERYAEDDPDFVRFTETFASGKTDDKIEELVLRIFRITESMVEPESWYRTVLENYSPETEEELTGSAWCRWYLDNVRTKLLDYAAGLGQIAEAAEASVPLFVPMLENEKGMLETAAHFTEYREVPLVIERLNFGAVNAKKLGKTPGDPALEALKKDRKNIIDKVKAIAADHVPAEALIALLHEIRPQVETLVTLVRDFSERFREEKKRRMIADFSDIARMALHILRTPEGEPTDIARQFAAHFDEIMIDEYQDSNEIQEAILTAVSREDSGHPNMFMVGDVKQSIYRFRMARPELFNQKYNTYTAEDSPHEKVELHMNFRSREEVLSAVNAFFYEIMQEKVGGIRYDDACALYPCDTVFPEYEPQEGEPERVPLKEEPELMLLDLTGSTTAAAADPEEGTEGGPEAVGAEGADTGLGAPDTSPLDAPDDPEETDTDEVEFDLTSIEWEARMVAQKIRALVDPRNGRVVYDNDLRRYRPLRYGDIMILLRTGTGWADTFLEVLFSEGIPASSEGSRGYYSSREVQLVLDLLTVIDNPVSDIPLAAVMHSPIFNFSSEELAVIRNGYFPREQGLGFYGAAKYAMENGEGVLQEKLRNLFDTIDGFRTLSHEVSLSELLRRIMRKTGLLYIMGAMPGGSRRRANLEMLITKAAAFEETSYHGVFQFIRYIDKLKSYELDEGENVNGGENENVVRIMTIHKSKGLESTVVFLSGLGKGFNRTDGSAEVVVHQDLGIGTDLVDTEARTKTKNPLRKVLSGKLKEESTGEELRVLYVAMTRAREKLYLTGSVRSARKMEAYRRLLAENETRERAPLTYTELLSSETMMEWLLRAYRPDMPVTLTVTSTLEVASGIPTYGPGETTGETESFRDVLRRAPLYEEETRRLRHVLTADYLYDDLYRTDATVSVSRLKQEHMQKALTESAPDTRDILTVRKEPFDAAGLTIPPEEHERIAGAARGTLYHSVLEWLDPHEEIEPQLDRWEKEGLISLEEKDTINPNRIRGFLFSSLGQRFVRAVDEGRAYREKQFIIGVPVQEVFPDRTVRDGAETELVMIQGIIDMYFEEDGGIILVDYKTDRVYDPDVLARMYREQLLLYRRAVSMFSHLPVREMWIWSLTMDRAILIED
ncbi:MAG: UvrD-helicase domain-containing protein [Lachnospiraceae bacterium]|nr:UvrD-helicase domain-containing protein [Lachnospiraceae bacterium]